MNQDDDRDTETGWHGNPWCVPEVPESAQPQSSAAKKPKTEVQRIVYEETLILYVELI